nr:flagellar hook-basal body complex protein [uncultured Eisenbergiella sp.]
MVGSMFAAISGLKAHQSKMDVIGNNIANVNTWGFKSHSANFADATYRTSIAGGAGTATTGGGVNPSQVGYGANVNSITVNYTTGNRNPTGWGSDCMIDGPGFFVVTTAQNLDASGALKNIKDENVMLSRVGILKIDNQGYLVDDKGNYVVGSDGKTIKTNEKDANATYSSLTVQTDGTVTGVRSDAGNEGKVDKVGQIGVASIQNPSGLEKTQGYYYRIGPNAGTVSMGAANKATGEILGGYLEMSNTDLSTEMANMITTQRGFQANTKIITVTDQMLEELVNMKR